MKRTLRRLRAAAPLTLVVLLGVLAATPSRAASYGRLTGVVRGPRGNPLMGATVVVTGPQRSFLNLVDVMAQRVTTDAQGRFSVRRLAPGWYSLQVISSARLPAMRDRIRIRGGRTTEQNFVLGSALSAFGRPIQRSGRITWGQDWKWILRTSASTRPVLRFAPAARAALKGPKLPNTPSQHLIGILPGSSGKDGLSEVSGAESVVAYLRPLSQSSDLLLVGSLGSGGVFGPTFAASLRRNMLSANPQEISVEVHRLDMQPGMAAGLPAGHGGLADARGVVVTYSGVRRLSPAVTLTAGFETDYLSAGPSVTVIQPRMELAYKMDHSTRLAFRVGAPPSQTASTLAGRLNTLGDFPLVSLQGGHPRMENVRHLEAALEHQWGRNSRVQLAAFSDFFSNAALWGFGDPSAWAGMSGNVWSGAGGREAVLNAGNYRSNGVRVEYARRLGSKERIEVMYSLGDSLAPVRSASSWLARQFQNPSEIASRLQPERAQAISGKLTASLPKSHTEIITSYTWLTTGTVTVVDPYGLSQAGMSPYLGVQIQQPLPTVAFLPAHIEATAEFRNLLDQGAVPVSGSNGKPIFLTPAYRTLRGGFSVQF